MRTVCREIQEAVATDGARILQRNDAAQEHAAECMECFRYLEVAVVLESTLEEMPLHDAPEPLVERLLGSDAGEWTKGAPAHRPSHVWLWSGVAAAGLVLVAALRVYSRHTDIGVSPPPAIAKSEAPPEPKVEASAAPIAQKQKAASRPKQNAWAFKGFHPPAPAPSAPVQNEEPASAARESAGVIGGTIAGLAAGSAPEPSYAMVEHVEVVGRREQVDLEKSTSSTKFSDEFVRDLPVEGRFYQNVLTLAPGASDEDADGNPNVSGARSRDVKAVAGGVSNTDPFAGQLLNYVNPDSIEEIDVVTAGAMENSVAKRFLEKRSSLVGIQFIEPKGYWANSYVPGDAALRLLRARLGTKSGPHDGARQPVQPFDPPKDAALGVVLHADRRVIEGESRLLVQVGLQGTPRHGGRRPAMNLGVVLDLRGEVPTEVASGMRALLGALAQASESGDRFRLVVAGRAGGLVVPPESFRHGPLMVTLDRYLGDVVLEGAEVGVEDAVRQTLEQVARADDPSGPLGASAILLVTGQRFGDGTRALADMLHLGAVSGIPASVVGVGTAVELSEIDRLSLSGQGNRRLMTRPAEARSLVDRELSAVSRAVARAVRVRIRLAPGVKLINVLGSESLDAERSQRVREAEQSIDRRLAQNLGIDVDRGKDEDGIQILIPTFYAGDSHVVLLDVAASGPGPVADVHVRFKDLTQLRNAVADASLTLAEGNEAAGPLERNVLENLLALKLSIELDEAGKYLAVGDRVRATSVLSGCRVLLIGLRGEVPGMNRDASVEKDIDMLDEYLARIDKIDQGREGELAYLSDSMRYAARLKILPRPVVN